VAMPYSSRARLALRGASRLRRDMAPMTVPPFRDGYSQLAVRRLRRLVQPLRDDAIWSPLVELGRGFEWFRPKTRYIVLRPAPGLPPGWMPDHLDGMWYEPDKDWWDGPSTVDGDAKGRATGRYERRDDGYLAEVYEVGPA
jgi:hypothetical protein